MAKQYIAAKEIFCWSLHNGLHTDLHCDLQGFVLVYILFIFNLILNFRRLYNIQIIRSNEKRQSMILCKHELKQTFCEFPNIK